MKKYLGIIIAAICILFYPSIETASAAEQPKLTATYTESGVSITGTDYNMLAVVVQIRDKDGKILTMESKNVLNDGSFALEINDVDFAAETEYFVYAADYEGGEWTTTSFTTNAGEAKFLCEALSMNLGTDVAIEDVYDDDGLEVTFQSSDETVFVIDGEKLVPKKMGTARFLATWKGETEFIEVKVYDPTLLAPNAVYLGDEAVTLEIQNGVGTTEWSVSDPSILSITEQGVIQGVSIGEATVTAVNNGKTLTKKIYVYNKPNYEDTIVEVKLGETLDVAAVFEELGVTDGGHGTIKYTPSTKNIATIDEYGILTPVRLAKVTVYAKVDGKSYRITVKIVN